MDQSPLPAGAKGSILAARKKSSLLRSILAVIMGLLLLGLAVQAIFGPTGHLEMERLEEENQSLIREREVLELENQQVLDEIESLKTDPDAIEKIAREELGLVREGEIKIVTKPDLQGSPASESRGGDSTALSSEQPPQQSP
jgi:cell division protein FtsB